MHKTRQDKRAKPSEQATPHDQHLARTRWTLPSVNAAPLHFAQQLVNAATSCPPTDVDDVRAISIGGQRCVGDHPVGPWVARALDSYVSPEVGPDAPHPYAKCLPRDGRSRRRQSGHLIEPLPASSENCEEWNVSQIRRVWPSRTATANMIIMTKHDKHNLPVERVPVAGDRGFGDMESETPGETREVVPQCTPYRVCCTASG